MKVLCLCSSGSVRSVTIAHILKHDFKIDALSAGLDTNLPDTLKMLYQWADHIIIVEPQMLKQVPQQYRDKIILMDLGEDVWKRSLHPDLVKKIESKFEGLMHQYAGTEHE